MKNIKIHVFHTGEVCVAPDLPFGGDHSNAIKASGIFGKKSDRIWLPVSAYLIEHPKGKFLVDTGWARDISPKGEFDKKAQIKSLGSLLLYEVNQGRIGLGKRIDEQLLEMGIRDTDIDDEVAFANKVTNKVRYYKGWWDGIPLTKFEWNDTQGPVGKSYDLLGDGSIELINIPGHADGLFAVKVKNEDGKFVLLFSDGGYARKSWEEMITSGIAADKQLQKQSLAWIREQSLDENCVESLANHDPDIAPHLIEL